MTTLVFLLFIYMIPIDCKITNCDRILENQPLCHIWPLKYFQLKQGIAQHKSTLQWAQIQSVPWITRNSSKYFNSCMCTAVATTQKCQVLFISRVTKWLTSKIRSQFFLILVKNMILRMFVAMESLVQTRLNSLCRC